MLSHACIIDGVRLHMGKRFVFPITTWKTWRNSYSGATRLADETGGGILVITEESLACQGIWVTSRGITALKKKYNFRLFVDDARLWNHG